MGLLTTCPLCQAANASQLIVQTDELRIVWGGEADHPCLVRVVWHDHVTEMSDLSSAEKTQLMHAVFAVEAAMCSVLAPKKMNLASLGNWVPHLHWHLIPRWEDDAHWPNSIWAEKQRDPSPRGMAQKAALASAIIAQLKAK
jgi:diadenosine tetraphosphate (Ap4A) HIT family hydrolase